MSGCILHFGMHKTGSSSIQDSLHAGLSDPRFHYVDLGRANASAALTMCFSEHPEQQSNARKRGISRDEALAEAAEARARLQRELQHATHATCILSAEHVVHLKPDGMAALAAQLRACGEPLRLVGYVRKPASYMESVFQQNLKGGREDFDAERLFPPYRRRFGRLEKAFGRAKPEYWPFEPRNFHDHCVVQDFCLRVGIDFPTERVVRTNESLSLPAVRVLYAYRRVGPGYGTGKAAIQQNLRLARELASLPGPRLRLHADLVAPVLAEMSDDIRWMEARLGHSLEESLCEDDTAIRSEADLLCFGEELDWLAQRTPGGALAPDPVTVAQRLDELRRPSAAPSGVGINASEGLFGRLRRMLGRAR